ncbi:hypothetical protein [Falsirhodobacter sp. alg1]|uniref:hypothetical protein n=1 Tax=Falsirhodobacter sp. alg1 TaxID=1472418 RepID=UPI0005F0AB18|nr:hypothetical protein [Falsirhodobacter sp. alg1]
MHLLLQIDTTDYDGWKSQWDGDAENRSNAGMTQLQIWRGVDTPGRVFALMDVHNPDNAKAWIAKETSFGGTMTATFLKTV